MVPSTDDDPVLSAVELEMRYGQPVIHRQTDYSRLAKFYRQAVSGEAEDKDFATWNAKPLQDFHRAADQAAMEYCHRLLVLRDQYLLQHASTKGFYTWLKDLHGYEQTDRTLRRQVCHARMALILAGCGRIDFLPSQNTATIIATLLPREAWAAFLSAFPVKEAGKATLQRKIVGFANRQNIPLRMTPIIPPTQLPSLPEKESTDLDQEETNPTLETVIVPPTTPAQAEDPDPLPEKLAPAMAAYTPRYWLENQSASQMAKRLTRLLKAKIKTAPRPARHAQRMDLHRQIADHSPHLADQISEAALQYFYDEIEKGLPKPKKAAPLRDGADQPKPQPGHGVSGS